MVKNNSLFISIFILLAIIVGYYVSHLGLYIDDFTLIFPAVLKSFASHFKQYAYDYGLFRPISLIYYYFIYFFYTLSPALSHLFVFALHTFTSVLLFSILKKQSSNKKLSLAIALLYLLHPFATEQYMWFSANPAVLVNLLFFLQISIILTFKREITSFFLVFFLSVLSVFIYESSFFFFIPLSYLFITQYRNTIGFDKLKKILSFSLILAIPNFIYIATKLLFPPHVSQPRFIIENLPELSHNMSTFLNSLGYLSSPLSLNYFWLSNIQNGFTMILSNKPIFALFLLAIGLILYALFKKNNDTFLIQKSSLYFWTIAFISSVFPLFVLRNFNFPFRSLFLPIVFCVLILSLFFIKRVKSTFLSTFLKLGSAIIIIFSLLITVSIATKYSQQFTIDTKFSQNIKDIVTVNGFSDNYPSYVIIENFSHSHVYTNFLYADHILSCFSYYWCAQASLNMTTGRVKNIGIKLRDGNLNSASELPYEDFIKKRPLVILQALNDNLEVETIYR